MSTAKLDLSGQEVKLGDWIIQADKGDLKMGLVVGFAKTSGNIRAVSFFYGRVYKRQPDGKYGYGDTACWNRFGPYTIQYSNRTFVFDPSRVDPALLEHIRVDLKGNPLYDPEEQI